MKIGMLLSKKLTMVSEKIIKELQEIIKEEYGREVTLIQASEIGNGLVSLYDLLAKIYHEDKNINKQKL